MEPREASGGWMPKPRKLMLASLKMALLKPMVMLGNRTCMMFGKICRAMIRKSLAPIRRALFT